MGLLFVLMGAVCCFSLAVAQQIEWMHGKMRRAISNEMSNEFVFVKDRDNATSKPAMMMILQFEGIPAPTAEEMGSGLSWIRGYHDLARSTRFHVLQVQFSATLRRRENITAATRGVLGIPTVSGVRSILVVLVTLNGTTQECSVADLRWHLHEQQYNLNNWYGATTGGMLTFNNDLNGDGSYDITTVTLNPQPSCTETVIAARDAVLSAGVFDSTNYDHFLLVMPHSYTACGLGFATVGCDIYKEYADGCWATVSQCGQLCLTLHELGHNIGLLHSGILMPDQTTYIEYADHSDIMGSSYWHPMHRKGYNAVQLWRLGVISDAETRVVPSTDSVAQYGLLFNPYFGSGVTRLWRLGTTGNYFLSFRQAMHPGVDRHVDMGYYWNALGMPSASGRLVIYRWETDASVTSPDGITLVGALTEGQVGVFGGYTVKLNWIHFSGTAAMVSVGGDVWYYYVYYWPYYMPSSVDNQIVENYPQYYVWTESCREAPGEAGATFPSWNSLPLLSAIPFDATFYRISLPIPQGSHVLRAEVIFESDIGITVASNGFRQPIAAGGDGKLVLRTQLIDHDNVYWPLWAGPIHGLPVLDTYSDFEVSNLRGIDEVAVDVTAAVQAFVNRPTWNPSGKALFRFTRANWTDPDVFFVSRGMCYNYWQCAPQLRFSYRPPGQKKRHQVAAKIEHVKRLPLPTVSVATPPALVLGVPFPIAFVASSAAVTSFVAISVDNGTTYEMACPRVDYPNSVCVYTRVDSVTVAAALLRVIAYNAEGGPAVAFSSPFPILNPPPSVPNVSATVAQSGEVSIPVSFQLGLAALWANVSLTSQPAFGRAVWSGAASAIVYSGDATHNGLATIGFQVCDNLGACTAALARVTVTPVAPSVLADSVSTVQGTKVTIAVLANDSGLVFPLVVSAVSRQPAHGTATVGAGGTAVVYDPQVTFFGTDNFLYSACDASVPPSCGTATVTVTVTAVPPRAVADSATTVQGTTVTIDVVANDVLGPAPLSSVTIVSRPTRGTVTFAGSNIVRYTPSSSCWNGADNFTYQLTDASGQSSAPAAVTVLQTAGAAPSVRGDAFVVGIGAALLNVTANDVLSVLCAPWTLSIDTRPAKGTASVAADASVNFTSTVASSVWLTYRVCDASAPQQLCSSSANVSIVTASSKTTFVTPTASSSWAAGALQNVSFSQTLGVGSSFLLRCPATGLAMVLPGTLTTARVWALVRMPVAPGAVSLTAQPVGQPALQVLVSFSVVSASITSVTSPTLSLRIGTAATVSWRHNVGLLETGFSVWVNCTGPLSSLQIADGLASSVTSATWIVAGTSAQVCRYSVKWQNTVGNGGTFKLQ